MTCPPARRVAPCRPAPSGPPARAGRRRALAWAAAGAWAPLPAWWPAPALARAALAPGELPDYPLRNAQGQAVGWRSQVLGDRITVVNFVFTTCTSLCPTTSALMAVLQERLRSRAELTLVSLSLDPLSDTPARLRAFAAPFQPGPRWHWLTGDPAVVFRLLEALDADPGGNPNTHGPTWLVGRAGRGPWQRLLDMPEVAQFQAAVDRLQ